jgi:hypothetical protein
MTIPPFPDGAYLKINGEWADHVLTSKIRDDA